jgi:hypothetical protein
MLIERLQIHPDDRGFFAELERSVSLFMSLFSGMNFASAVMRQFSPLAGPLP